MLTRRRVLATSPLFAAPLLAESQQSAPRPIGEPPGRIAPVKELVNASEFEAMAQRKLDSLTFAEIAGSERAALDRITLRPRLMIDTTKIDLGATLFGQKLFMPILAGPISHQKRFHPEGELAMARGASAAQAPMVVSEDCDYPIDQIAKASKTPLWYQVYAQPDIEKSRAGIERAVGAGCKVLFVTVGVADQAKPAASSPPMAGTDWAAIDRLRKGFNIPVVLKGVMNPEEAQKAIATGMQGIVVSNYSGRPITGIASPIEVLPAIAGAVAGKIPILMDGSLRLGSDVMKALALGAQGVLLGRPAVWGLAAYGDAGVQNVIELIQSEFGRDMAMCGKISIKALDRTAVKIHRR